MLVEKLTARGLLKVVCGSDTLGVPTRTFMEDKFKTLVKPRAMIPFILRSHLHASQAAEKDWLNTVGTRQDDSFSREADQLGEARRQNATD